MRRISTGFAGLFGAACVATTLAAGAAAAGELQLSVPDSATLDPGAFAGQTRDKALKFNCATTKSATVVKTGVQSSPANDTPEPIPFTKVYFKTTGAKSCIIVRFSAEAAALAESSLHVLAVLDGAVQLQPLSVILLGNQTEYFENQSAEFLIRNVAAGKHNIQMYFSVNGPAATPFAGIQARVTTVEY